MLSVNARTTTEDLGTNSNCGCTLFHEEAVKRLAKLYSRDDYDDVHWSVGDDDDTYKHCDTYFFTKNTDQLYTLCPKHHPFFYYLAGVLHLKPRDVLDQFVHAWVHVESGTLKLWLKHQHPLYEKLVIGLHKAWRYYSGHKDSTAHFYYVDTGSLYGTEVDEPEDYNPDAWEVLSSLGRRVWSTDTPSGAL